MIVRQSLASVTILTSVHRGNRQNSCVVDSRATVLFMTDQFEDVEPEVSGDETPVYGAPVERVTISSIASLDVLDPETG